jgi:sugar phosphate isomerase/epimerase
MASRPSERASLTGTAAIHKWRIKGMKTSRRDFLRTSGMLVGGMVLAGSTRQAAALPNDHQIGFQTFEIFKNLTDDWQGTWNTMAGMGYRYADLDHFGPIAKHTPEDINQSLAEAGLGCTICHFLLDAYNDESFPKTMETAHALKGVKTVIVTGAGGRASSRGGEKLTMDDWEWLADQLNGIGAKVEKEGFHLGYHNHDTEFIEINGKVPYDVLLESTDPKLVRFQIDVGNLTFGGGNAYHYLSAYPHRYLSMHVKDFKPGMAAVPVGDGILDWKRIFALAKKDEITNYVAEVGAYVQRSLEGQPLQQSSMDVLELFRRSAVFLRDFRS